MSKPKEDTQVIAVREGGETVYVASGTCTDKCGELHCAAAPRERQARVLLHQSFTLCDGVQTQFENVQPLALSATA